jgi:hypothetical protein
VDSGQQLISLPGYRSEIVMSNKVPLLLIGNLPTDPNDRLFESAVTLHDNRDVDLDLTLQRGRIVIGNRPTGAALVRVRFHDQAWEIRLQQPTSEIGLEIRSRVLPGTGPWVPYVQVALLVEGGDVELIRNGKTEVLPPRKVILWNSLAQESDNSPNIVLKETRGWMLKKNTYPEDVRKAVAAFSDRMSRKPRIADDRTSMMAIACQESLDEESRWEQWAGLWTLGAMDQLRDVIRTLEKEDQFAARFAAIDALVHWLGRQPDQDAPLKSLLEERGYSAAESATLLQLLRGYDQINVDIVNELLGQLSSRRTIIRELAFLNLREAFGPDKLKEFNPLAPPELRERALEIIRARLTPRVEP